LVTQGGGGGSSQESYELAMWFLATKSKLDSLDKRGKRGYLFIVGDEQPYDSVSKVEVEKWIGDTLEADIPTETVVAELKRKFDVFWIYPTGAQNAGNQHIQNKLTHLFGQRVIKLNNPADICTTIAATIAVNEGRNPRTVIQELKEGLVATSATDAEIAAIVAAIPPRRLDDI
jgi:hypothetical protein